MNFRKVSIKDYTKIKKLFSRNGLKIIPFQRWVNLWKKNPAINNKKKWTKGWIMEKNGKIVGHFGSFPTQYFLNNKSYTCSVLYGWAVDKKYRSQSILLLKKVFIQPYIDFFLGTTTGISAGKIMEALGAKQIPLQTLGYSSFVILNLKNTLRFVLRKKVLPFKKILASILTFFLPLFFNKRLNYWKNKFSDRNLIKIQRFNSNFNHIWNRIKISQKNKFLLKRDKRFLEWHLGHFLKNKKAWVILNIVNKKVYGYAICIVENNKEGLRRAFLIDLISFDKRDEIFIKLIAASIKEAKRRNCDIFEMRGFDKEKRSYIESFHPFEKKLSHNTFYYKSNNNKLNNKLNKYNYWNITNIDGDAIINF